MAADLSDHATSMLARVELACKAGSEFPSDGKAFYSLAVRCPHVDMNEVLTFRRRLPVTSTYYTECALYAAFDPDDIRNLTVSQKQQRAAAMYPRENQAMECESRMPVPEYMDH